PRILDSRALDEAASKAVQLIHIDGFWEAWNDQREKFGQAQRYVSALVNVYVLIRMMRKETTVAGVDLLKILSEASKLLLESLHFQRFWGMAAAYVDAQLASAELCLLTGNIAGARENALAALYGRERCGDPFVPHSGRARTADEQPF